MGQYYRPVLEQDGQVTVYNRDVNGEYTMAKLMEHSYNDVPLIRCIAYLLSHTPSKLAWVGDYTNNEDLQEKGMTLTTEDVWGIDGEDLTNVPMLDIESYLFVNHDKKVYIDMKKYKELSHKFNDGEYEISPISLLTAIGNNRGGGDYRNSKDNTCFNEVGSWAWDTISLEHYVSKEYKEIKNIVFTECANDNKEEIIRLGIENSFDEVTEEELMIKQIQENFAN